MSKILIVDSSPFMRGSLKYLLEHADHKVIGHTDNLKEAEDIYRGYLPDLVFIDIAIDDDFHILKAILAIKPSPKVVISASAGYEDRKKEAMSLGSCGAISKPFDFDEINRELNRVLKIAGKS